MFASDLREASARLPDEPGVMDVVEALLDGSEEFARIWAEHEVGRHHDQKRLVHPERGVIDVHCQHLHDPGQMQTLLVFTATPGTQAGGEARFPQRPGSSAGGLSGAQPPRAPPPMTIGS